INEGQSAPLGQLIAVIGEPNEDIASLLSEAPAPAAPAPKQEEPKQEQEKPAEQPAHQPPTQPQAKAAVASAASAPAARSVDNGQPKTDSGRMVVSPLAARMAAEAGIDLRSLQGSGPGGRIIKR